MTMLDGTVEALRIRLQQAEGQFTEAEALVEFLESAGEDATELRVQMRDLRARMDRWLAALESRHR